MVSAVKTNTMHTECDCKRRWLDAIGSAMRGVAEMEAKSPRIVTHRLDAGRFAAPV